MAALRRETRRVRRHFSASNARRVANAPRKGEAEHEKPGRALGDDVPQRASPRARRSTVEALQKMTHHASAPATTAAATMSAAPSAAPGQLRPRPSPPARRRGSRGSSAPWPGPAHSRPAAESSRPGSRRALGRARARAPPGALEKDPASANSSAVLSTPSASRAAAPASSSPAPSAVATAQSASPEAAPSATRTRRQKPRASARRMISALIGPGGQATDQPSTKPSRTSDVCTCAESAPRGGSRRRGGGAREIGQAGASRPPMRSGAMRRASPLASSVSTNTPHRVAGPSATSSRSPGILRTKRCTAASLRMPITES